MTISFTVNGHPAELDSEPETTLLFALRNKLELNSPRYGCGSEQCGACRVLVDDSLAYACTMPLSEVAGKDVVTVEGLPDGDKLHPLQTALLEVNAGQCGYCLSGILMAAHALLARNPRPTREQIQAALDDHLCRCGAHNRIIKAIQMVADNG